MRNRGEPESPGTVVFSIDVELAWGCFYRVGPGSWRRRLQGARVLLRRLLEALDERQIGLTWAFVGHLFLESCSGRHGSDGRIQDWYGKDWFGLDPGSDLDRDPEWYGADMIRLVRQGGSRHEIAAHGFSHCFFDDPAVSAEVAEQEIAAAVDAAAGEGVALSSFVFPRNRVGHTPLLKKAGFSCYRTEGREMGRSRRRGVASKAGHVLRQALGIAPEPEQPVLDGDGLVAIPGTVLYLSTAGWRRAIPVRARVSRAVRGMARAAARGGLCHLWCHLEDFLESGPAYHRGFLEILDHAARLRDRRGVRLMTMKAVAEEVARG